MTNVCSLSGEKSGTLRVKVEELHPDAGATLERAGISMHGLRCACADCLAEREEIRRTGLFIMATDRYDDHERDAWADKNWDSPSTHFPGANSNDTERAQHDRYTKKYVADKLA